MFGQGGPVKVYVATRPVDFCKGIDGLALAVQEMFGLDPFCGAVFVFRSKRADRIKLLVWDQTGMVLVHKRLEGAAFVWPQVRDGVMRMSSAQLAAQFQVLVTRRPRYACRHCSQAVVQAYAPDHVVPGGLPTGRLIAWIIVSRFGDPLPFYRQAGIFERQGLHLDRGTPGNWVGRACFHLMPVIDHMKADLRAADRVFVDETRAPVLDPGRKATKSGYFVGPSYPTITAIGGAGPPIVFGHSFEPVAVMPSLH